MPKCGYCSRSAVAIIPATPRHVCTAHAIEYWTGLLAYARNHPPQEKARELIEASRHEPLVTLVAPSPARRAG